MRLFICGHARCLDSETEVLSPQGWLRISEYSGQEILIFDKTTEKAKFEKPSQYLVNDFDGEFIRISNGQLDMVMTPDHTVLYKTSKNNWYEQSAGSIFDKSQANINGFSARIPCFVKTDNPDLPFSDEQLRFIVMFAADGCVISKQGKSKIQVKRPHKIYRVRESTICHRVKTDQNSDQKPFQELLRPLLTNGAKFCEMGVNN